MKKKTFKLSSSGGFTKYEVPGGEIVRVFSCSRRNSGIWLLGDEYKGEIARRMNRGTECF